MSDDVSVFAVPDIAFDDAHRVAVGVRRWLVRNDVIEDRISDSALGESGAFRPSAGAARATPNRIDRILAATCCGVEFSFGREVVAPFGDGYSGTAVTCPSCHGSWQAEDEGFAPSLDRLGDWLDGGPEPRLDCLRCGRGEAFGRLVLEPVWCLAEFAVKVWNWGLITPWFERSVLDLLPPRTQVLHDRI